MTAKTLVRAISGFMLVSVGCGVSGFPSIDETDELVYNEAAAEDCKDTRIRWPTDPTVDSKIVDNSEDIVWYYETPHPSGRTDEICLTLEVDTSISWWKRAEVSGSSGKLAFVETQDSDRGPKIQCFPTRFRTLSSSFIKLSKAKFLGIHTGMYCLFDLSSRKGKTLNFFWEKD